MAKPHNVDGSHAKELGCVCGKNGCGSPKECFEKKSCWIHLRVSKTMSDEDVDYYLKCEEIKHE